MLQLLWRTAASSPLTRVCYAAKRHGGQVLAKGRNDLEGKTMYVPQQNNLDAQSLL